MNTRKHKFIRVCEYEKLFIEENKDFKRKHWNALCAYNERNYNKYFTALHNGIRFNNYVGVIQADDLTIEIVPKIDSENIHTEEKKGKWHKVLLQMLRECKILKVDHAEKANLKLRANSILDIYIDIFLSEVETLFHKGLIKKYRKQTENISALKGRLNFPKHISSNIIHKEKFFVQYAVYDRQNKLNQILNEAIKIIHDLISNSSLLDKLGRIALNFPEMKNINVDDSTFSSIQYDRKSIHYKEAIEIAKMLLLNYRPDITGGTNNVIAILFDMNKLWEEYIYVKLRKAAVIDVHVSRQQSQSFWKKPNATPKMIRPDIVITKQDEITVIDTKWKLNPYLDPSVEDLRQMFSYNLYWKCDHSILLYPANKDNKESGSYFKFKSQVFENNHCSIIACNILDADDCLDKSIGERLINKLKF